MTEYMKPVLTGRELTSDEQHILYGKPSSNDMTYFKSDSFENLIGLLEAVYNGETVDLPMAPKNNCMYLFFETPVGTKHYFYDLTEYNKPVRDMIGDTPVAEIKYRINSFLIPKFAEGFAKIDANRAYSEAHRTPQNYYNTMNIKYEHLAELFSGGLFVNTNGTRVVSITTGLPKARMQELLFSNSTALNKFKTTSASLPVENKQEQLAWYTYCIPTDVQKRVNLPELSEIGSPLLGSRLFDWAKHTYLVVSDKYLRVNGFVLNNGVPQLALSWGGLTGSLQTADHNLSKYVNSFSSYVESFIFSSSNQGFAGMNKMFQSGQVGAVDVGYYHPKTNIVCFNKDSLEVVYKPYLANVHYSEHINIDTFLGELRDTYIAEGYNKSSEAYAKQEFKLNPDPLANEADYTSSRYEIVKSTDHKMMFVTKTSLAKDALKQAKISRKITESCAPVINFIINLFAACDLEFPGTNRSAAICTYSKQYSGYGHTTWASLDPALKTVYDSVMANFRTELATKSVSICTPLVDDLYKNFNAPTILNNFEAFKAISSLQTGRSYGRDTLARQGNIENQKALVCSYLFKDMVNQFNSTLFSPSSNMLNYMALAQKMYQNFGHAGIPSTLGLVMNNGHLTGPVLAHFYPNNFISISETLDKQIENCKTNTYIYVNEHQVPISTCFNWSQEAADCFGVLKKCKTFTDYYNWYKGLYPVIQNRITTVIQPGDEIGATTLTNIAHAYLMVLEGLSTGESPYLPAPKTRGRKKKVVAPTTTEDSTEESDETTTEEESVTSTASV